MVIFSPARTANPDKPFKDTYTTLVETKECVVQMVSSDIVKPQRVKESPFQMECKLLEMKQLGDQPGAGNLAICEVLKFHVDPSVLNDKDRIDPNKIDLIGRNGEYYYTRASGDAIFEMK